MRFLTIFLPCENIHLAKDVGMIPYVLHKVYGFNSTIASYNNGEYPYLETEVKGLKHVFVEKKFKNDFLNTIIFLFGNYKQYDILQIYHFGLQNLTLLFLFKMLNRKNKKAKVYLKMDQNENIRTWRIKGFKRLAYDLILNKVDLVSIETKNLYDYTRTAKMFNKTIKYIPNGFYDNGIRPNLDCTSKENYIFYSGVVGDSNKSTEVLLEAFVGVASKYPEWELKLAGSIKPEFESYIHKYFNSYPEMKKKVTFLGYISDRKILDKLYLNAKIFALTSKSEGFALVYLEALKMGAVVVSSSVTPAYDVTDNEKYGKIFDIDSVNGLYDRIVETINELNNKSNINFIPSNIQSYAYKTFYWPVILETVRKELGLS